MSVVKRSTATNKVAHCSRRYGERVSEQTGNDKGHGIVSVPFLLP